MKIPEGIRNEASWVSSCCRISARARDLLEGRLDLFAVARSIRRLAIATKTDYYNDQDLRVFALIYDDLSNLPVGSEREHWSEAALLREGKKIGELESRWRAEALTAASNLVERYAWAYERRAELRQVGHVLKED